jgi:DNA-binding MltR family transcriptional regulator
MLLENILINFLADDEKEVKKLLQYDQPLGTYGNRITTAYCLGLISKTIRDDLRFVGKIRNKFAHDLYASFENEKIQSWCISLRWHRIGYMEPPLEDSARDLFQVGVNRLVAHMNGLVSIAKTEKRTIRLYP